jgi:cellulose biosynthesis protein BcsQ
VATNLAIYLRALREELAVAVVGLDDQQVVDRMFALAPLRPGEPNLKHGWAERSLDRVLQLGEYGVYFVPSPPDVSLLKGRAEDPGTLRGILARTHFDGVVVLDTKSDVEALTRNAWTAADRILVPVADWSSLEEAGKTFRWLERGQLPIERARIVFTLVDRRSRVASDAPLLRRLEEEVARRGWPRYETTISRSPRVEGLLSGTRKPLSILHHARGTAVHGELRELAREVLRDLDGLASGGRDGGEPGVLWGRTRSDSAQRRPGPFPARRRSGAVDWLGSLRRR